MKNRWLAIVLTCVMLFGTGALAQNMEERTKHLLEHEKRDVFFCSGKLVKLRVAPNANKMHGRLTVGDQFEIIDSFGEWMRVEVTEVSSGNKEARCGMTGWIHVDHIVCLCDMEEEQTAESSTEEQ